MLHAYCNVPQLHASGWCCQQDKSDADVNDDSCFVALCFDVALFAYCLLVSCIDPHYLVMPYLVLLVILGLLIGCLRFCFVWISVQNHARPGLHEPMRATPIASR